MFLKKLAVIGAGQIGTSLSMAAARAYPDAEIIVYDTHPQEVSFFEAFEKAGIQGLLVNLTSNVAHLRGAQIVILATAVGHFKQAIASIAPVLPSTAIFTDVGSVKFLAQKRIRDALDEHLSPDTPYVPFHILNGNAGSGPESASLDVFTAPGVLIPGKAPAQIEETITQFWGSLGVTVHKMTADNHDLIVGTTSHLEHAIIFSLMNTRFMAEHLNQAKVPDPGQWLAAMSRIALAGPVMWADNFRDNAEKLVQTSRALRGYLVQFGRMLEKDDPKIAEHLFSLSNYARDMRSPRVSHIEELGEEYKGADLKVSAFLGLLSLAITANIERIELLTKISIAPLANPSLKDGMGPVSVDKDCVRVLLDRYAHELKPLVSQFMTQFDKTMFAIEKEDREEILQLVHNAGVLRELLSR